jgi:hypothetical protein
VIYVQTDFSVPFYVKISGSDDGEIICRLPLSGIATAQQQRSEYREGTSRCDTGYWRLLARSGEVAGRGVWVGSIKTLEANDGSSERLVICSWDRLVCSDYQGSRD